MTATEKSLAYKIRVKEARISSLENELKTHISTLKDLNAQRSASVTKPPKKKSNDFIEEFKKLSKQSKKFVSEQIKLIYPSEE